MPSLHPHRILITAHACALIAILLGLLSLLLAPGANAANLQISPVMINFRAGQGAAGITLQNLGDAPVYGQVRVYLWDQQQGDDVLLATQDVVASPPIIQIGPKSSQTIRLVRRAGSDKTGEQSYRVLIDEIARDDAPATSGVDIRLRYSVPVFTAPQNDRAEPQLTWQFFRKDGEWMLRLNNSGQLHAQLGAIRVTNGAGKEFPISSGLMGYALAGRVREWKLPLPKETDLSGALRIAASINGRAVTAAATVPER